MKTLVVLDSGPLGLACKSPGRPGAATCLAWIKGLRSRAVVVAVPEIARYEVRRELFRSGSIGGVNRLDHLHPTLAFLPITSVIMDVASELWAEVRGMGLPTASDGSIDGDAILAATALVAAESVNEVIIATENVAHLARFPLVESKEWRGVDVREWWTI